MIETEQIESLLKICVGAYADSTLRAARKDLRIFANWCQNTAQCWLPASPETIAAFIDLQVKSVGYPTIKHRINALRLAHRIAGYACPTDANVVRLALRRAARSRVARPKQALGLTADRMEAIISTFPAGSLRGLRDAALISVGYDTLCRAAEISAMNVDHLKRASGAECSVLIPHSKADPNGDGRIGWLSAVTMTRLQAWMDEAHIVEGPIFRRLQYGRVGEGRLGVPSIRNLVRRAARRAGYPYDCRATGHSMRVGAAQDMLLAGFDAAAIMQAGGWKSPEVLLRYVEHASTLELHRRRWAAAGRMDASADAS